MSEEPTEDCGDDSGQTGATRAQTSRARARARVAEVVPPNAQMARITTTLARIEETEDLLAAGNSPRRTAGIIAKQWGIGRRQAQEYVLAVHTRWLAESQAEDRESKRARMRAMVMRTYQAAMDRERGLVVNVGDFKQEVEYVADPDIRGAGNMLELLCRIDGLLEQPDRGTSGDINVNLIQVLQQHYGMTAEALRDIEAARPVLAASTGGDDD